MIEIRVLRGEDESRTVGQYPSVQITHWLIRDEDGNEIAEYHGDGWYVPEDSGSWSRRYVGPESGPWTDITFSARS